MRLRGCGPKLLFTCAFVAIRSKITAQEHIGNGYSDQEEFYGRKRNRIGRRFLARRIGAPGVDQVAAAARVGSVKHDNRSSIVCGVPQAPGKAPPWWSSTRFSE